MEVAESEAWGRIRRGGEDVESMKLRLILMCCILILIGAILLILRGYSPPLIGLPIVGIVLAAVGVLWKPRKTADNVHNDTH
jgi:hypothetical protein